MMSLHVDKQVILIILKTIIILGAYQKETLNTECSQQVCILMYVTIKKNQF